MPPAPVIGVQSSRTSAPINPQNMSCRIGIKSARVSSMGVEALAKTLLRELVNDEKGP